MNNLCFGSVVATLVSISAAMVGCAASGEMPAAHTTVPSKGDGSAMPAAPETDGASILLRTALLPSDSPQSVYIKLHERRETTGESFPETVYSLDLELHGSLKCTGRTEEGLVEAALAFQRIVVAYERTGREQHKLTYDSATDEPGGGNPLADLMQYIPDAVYALQIGPSGRLRALDGRNLRWGLGSQLLAPPSLLAVQWAFRDTSMSELVAEALFPPMPASPVREGDAWDVTIPANIPLVARIDSRLHSQLTRIDCTQKDHPVATISGVGKLSPAPDLIEGQPPAIRPTIRSGSHTVTQTVDPVTGVFSQQQQLELVADIVMKAPADDNSLTMTICRKRVVESKRNPETPRTVMAKRTNPST